MSLERVIEDQQKRIDSLEKQLKATEKGSAHAFEQSRDFSTKVYQFQSMVDRVIKLDALTDDERKQWQMYRNEFRLALREWGFCEYCGEFGYCSCVGFDNF